MAEGGPKLPKREDAGVVGTSPLNASGGSITVEGRKDGLSLGVPNFELDGVMSSSGGSPEDDDEEHGGWNAKGVCAIRRGRGWCLSGWRLVNSSR